VKLSVGLGILLVGISACVTFAQPTPNEPTKQEIEQAYQSKSGTFATFIPRHEWERWRIKEIRGWKLHFKRLSDKRSLYVATYRYQAVAKKNGSCREYRITDTVPLVPVPLGTGNPQLSRILVVEPEIVSACR
jgi:hypothetical protein